MSTVDPKAWRGRRVLITGHTGFKGAWLALWLQLLGAEVSGLARSRPGPPSLYALARVGDDIEHHEADLRDHEAVRAAVRAARPEVVFHLAAQPLVGRSLTAPVETYAVNLMGAVHLLDAVAATDSVRAVVLATSQDVYEDRDTPWPYREEDPIGVRHPYGSAKACVEVAAAAMRRSLLFGAGVNVATARVGNLLGGGDWGEARLVPDIMRAAVRGDALEIRSPDALRAWQYVLEPLRGYLMLADRLQGDPTAASAFNFGPGPDAECTVRELAERLGELWGKPLATLPAPDGRAVERHGVRLDSSRASARLGWRPAWSLGQTVDAVVEWYRAFERGGDLRAVSLGQIEAYAAAVGAVAATTLPPR